MKKVITRIAPSPTGDPHVGTAYIALFNYVFAKSENGQFFCRIENTDRQRSKAYFEKALFDAFDWLGFNFDLIYKQSDRLDIYTEYINILLNKELAYSDEGCVRLRSSGKTFIVNDKLRGDIILDEYHKDPVLMKSDGWPTYHFANVIDDHLSNITHVIRGEEWIVSTPIHLELYEAFEWEPPQFYHLSLLRNSDKSKLSKRRNPVSILYYQDSGFLSEALLNYLGTLGFSHPDGREIFSIDEMIKIFHWDRVSITGPVFDFQKLKYFNSEYIKRSKNPCNFALLSKLDKIWKIANTRISTLEEIITEFPYCFGNEVNINISEIKLSQEMLGELIFLIESTDFFEIANSIKSFFENKNIKPKEWYPSLNYIITGRRSCPPVFDIMEIIGKEITKQRLIRVFNMLKSTR